MTQLGEPVTVVIPKPVVKKDPDPTLRVRWSKPIVTPDFNNEWRLTTPPENPDPTRKPERAKVRLLASTTRVPNGTSVTITIHRCDNDDVVTDHEKKLDGLQVQHNRVVNPKTGKPPEFIFVAKHFDCKAKKTPWDPWDKPFFYFKVSISHKGLKGETSKDFKAKPADVLRVKYWHACLSDWFADNSPSFCKKCGAEYPKGTAKCAADGTKLTHTYLSTGDEMREIAGILSGVSNHEAYQCSFDQVFDNDNDGVPEAIPVEDWGSAIRNTYCYHHASHGNVDRIFLGETGFKPADVNNTGALPSVPRYLVYLNICLAGKKPGLGNAFVGRGTQNLIGFRLSIPDSHARKMARRFYTRWAGRHHRCDPSKIAQLFWTVAPPFYKTMRPVLMGPGGGKVGPGGVPLGTFGAIKEAIGDLFG